MSLTFHKNKTTASNHLKELGFTEKTGEGQCSDYAFGSRVYYQNPFTAETESISKLPGQWAASE